MGIFSLVNRYFYWLHGQWPSGKMEKLPVVNADGTTNVPGIYVVGDLTGIPLLKFAADSGARAIEHIASDKQFIADKDKQDVYDVIIIGGGISGYSAALEAKKRNVNYLLLEASEDFSTIKNFPNKKPIFTYPTDMIPKGEIQFGEDDNVKEALFENLSSKVKLSNLNKVKANALHVERKEGKLRIVTSEEHDFFAHRVILAIGKSGNYRQLNVEGEDNQKVVNRLHDPETYKNKKVVVVGGGDSALESVIAIADSQLSHSKENRSDKSLSDIKIVYRNEEFSRAKPENRDAVLKLEQEGRIGIMRSSFVKKIEEKNVSILHKNGEQSSFENDAILSLIGREAPLDFFRRSGIEIKGESTFSGWGLFFLFFLFVVFLYDWKNYGFLNNLWASVSFPDQMPHILSDMGSWWAAKVSDRSTLIGTIAISMKSRSFYYTVLYTSCIAIFGWQRIRRRKTPYVKVQTGVLFFVQFIPLFLLPEIILPWLGYMGIYDAGMGKYIADSLFPSYISPEALTAHQWPEWGHPRAYWHAYGFILAWPLNVYNLLTPTPIIGWLIISFIQTFILLPALIYKYGKGVYCGWICSCGALAETLGDNQRHKMPHGSGWNKLNFLGQMLLLVAILFLIARIVGWIFPDLWINASFSLLLTGENQDYKLVNALSWKWTVDVLLGGILGVGLYFKYSGRVWCRFACPLAALMNIYARFSRFRIFADKNKCISCNQCTNICHQGIDVMAFANKGKPMEDPQCVRCSACIQTCPTGVLQFGEIDRKTGNVVRLDKLNATLIKI